MSELNRFVLRPLLNVFTDCDILSSSGILFQRTIDTKGCLPIRLFLTQLKGQ